MQRTKRKKGSRFSYVSTKLEQSDLPQAYRPRCFARALDVSSLPVDWTSNRKAWMTSTIFVKWLKQHDQTLRRKHGNIVMFLDNAPCHPQDVSDHLTNIKLVFLPPGTTSKTRPLDAGIIRCFKPRYRGLLMRRLLDDPRNATASELAKDINILDAIYWAAKAFNSISNEIVQNCVDENPLPERAGNTDDYQEFS